jgi:hypothetical protein
MLIGLVRAQGGPLRIPAFTAYLDPDPEGARLSEQSGLTDWISPKLTVSWFGEFNATGKVSCAIALKLRQDQVSRLRLQAFGQSRDLELRGQGTNILTADFGEFAVRTHGFQRFRLESLNAPGTPNGDLIALGLSGPAAQNAQFNLKPRRNAASVHLVYPVPKEVKVEAFYCELTGLEDPVWTYYMACGWHRGYFGMQVNSPNERRIIFSVWDSGNEGIDRKNVADENRVRLVAKGPDVYSGDFGNEGTGGHSHLKFSWQTGHVQRFIVTAQPVDATHTIYAGYYFRPDQQRWMLISSWNAPKEGGYLRGLYSFSENFGGSNGHLLRKARYGNQWIRTADGKWTELTVATFSCDATGKGDRRDRFMGVEQGQFFLSHGGYITGFTAFGERFERPATGKPPENLGLPSLTN